jgi:hypothetical protein
MLTASGHLAWAVLPDRGCRAASRVRIPHRAGNCLGQGIFSAGTAGDKAVKAGHGEDAEHSASSGDNEPQPAAFGLCPLVRQRQL